MSKPDPKSSLRWLDQPEEHDYPAAGSFLLLLQPQDAVDDVLRRLRPAPLLSFKAKDIFRAAGLPLLDASNVHVARDRDKISAGKALSPILLVRDRENGRVVIADGYHRLCAVYSVDEDASIPCKIA